MPIITIETEQKRMQHISGRGRGFSRSAGESRDLDTNVLNSSLRFVSPALRRLIELLLHDRKIASQPNLSREEELRPWLSE